MISSSRHSNWSGFYNYYRTYDPSTGRYLESDPIGLAAGLNTYSYVSNVPTMRVDPFGLVEWNGTYFVLDAGWLGAEAKTYTFNLYSECVDGRRAFVRVRANALALSGSFPPVSASGTEITLRDTADDIYPSELIGVFSHFSFGVGYGVGKSGGSMTVGAAQSDFSTSTSGQTPSAEASMAFGRSYLNGDAVWLECENSCDE